MICSSVRTIASCLIGQAIESQEDVENGEDERFDSSIRFHHMVYSDAEV